MNKEDKQELILSDMQLKAELERCEYCEENPCREACPVDCSPKDFIMALRVGEPHDILRAAAMIMKNNPLGGICAVVCPDRHCMKECSHKLFDGAINIPDIQAEIIQRAKSLGGILDFLKPVPNGKKVAVIGSGPAGLGAAGVLSQQGYKVDIFEEREYPGGMCNLIPDFRLDKEVLKSDIEFLQSLGDITIKTNSSRQSAEDFLKEGYNAVIVSTGLWQPVMLGISGENMAITAIDYLSSPEGYKFDGKVCIIGGGATALDCAVTAKINGASSVEMFSLENIKEMPLTEKERKELIEYGIEVSPRTKVTSIISDGKDIKGIETIKIQLDGEEFSLLNLRDIKDSSQSRNDISHVIIAIGNRASKSPLPPFTKGGSKGGLVLFQRGIKGDLKKNGDGSDSRPVFYAGDCITGPTTVVEAVASGKNTALEVDSFLMNKAAPEIEKKTKNRTVLKGYVHIPVPLETDFFGRTISTPFLLSAASPTDGYEQMKKAYEAGWSGGIMKTAFDSIPIHIPGEYMHTFNKTTYGNCDNVSGHSLDRVCIEIEKLVKEYPSRLTMASTGGPVSGNDEEDMKVWQSNTRKLESSGVMGIEYSLSCPQGGDGSEGDIVSQNVRLTVKIIDWIMRSGNGDVPKLFKLTAAVTSIIPVMNAIKKILDKYPDKFAGVTLANTFPVMDFQNRGKKNWENGVLLGMSGEGVAPVSYWTLARAREAGVVISGNGGAMNYKQAAHFLALGAETVQFCTIVMKYGYGIFDELCSGISYLMKNKNINSMRKLIGIAQPDPVTDFMELSSTKKISSLRKELCVSCGNCTHCSYQAITLDEEGYPDIDPAKCIGCSICTKNCFTGALDMRERTQEELEQLKEE